MIPASVVTGGASAPAPATPAADTPTTADFTALLLLLMGVGTSTPQPEGQLTPDDPTTDTKPNGPSATDPLQAVAPSASLPTAAIALALVDTGSVSAPEAAVTDAPTTPSRPAVRATVATEPAPSIQTPSVIAPETTPSTPAPTPVPKSPADSARTETSRADVAPANVTSPDVAVAGQSPVVTPAPSAPTPDARHREPIAAAREVHHALRDLEYGNGQDAGEHHDEVAGAAIHAAARPLTFKGGVADTSGGRPSTDFAEHGDRRNDTSFHGGATAIGLPASLEAGAPMMARESRGVVETSAPMPLVDPHVVAEQVVRVARLVVSGEETQLHVQLDPPALGAVHVSAGARGDALEVTIHAERPETQALLTQALPEIQQALSDRGVGSTSVTIATTSMSSDGRRAPERRPAEPRERSLSHQQSDRRRAPSAARPVSAVDITV